MKGNTLNEFINDLYYNPEKEILFHNKRYMLSGFVDATGEIYTLEVYTIGEECKTVFEHTARARHECVAAFEKAKIFDEKTIYEAESDIEVLYG